MPNILAQTKFEGIVCFEYAELNRKKNFTSVFIQAKNSNLKCGP